MLKTSAACAQDCALELEACTAPAFDLPVWRFYHKEMVSPIPNSATK
jgi:hypothetical protein